MEEEYRMQKAQTDIKSVPNSARSTSGPVIHEDGTVDDGSSTRAIVSPPSPEPAGIPTIKISGEEAEGGQEVEREPDEGDIVSTPLHINGPNAVPMQKPVQAAGEDKQDSSDITAVAQAEPFSFSNKRLCERWLDNLFMVLYEVRTSCTPH